MSQENPPPYADLSTDELLRLAYLERANDPLVQELAARLDDLNTAS